MKLIINIPEYVIDDMKECGFIPEEDNEELCKAVENGTPIPDKATNGDVIKAIFPNNKYSEYFADVEMKTEENDTRFKSVFDRDWWDEPYQKGGNVE